MRIEVTRLPLAKAMLRNRWPQLAVTTALLVGFTFAILAGLLGTPAGSHNFAIVFTWIAWWGILILIAVPLFGRGWCSICPIPSAGEWLQRGAVLGPQAAGGLSLSRRWPRRLRNMWLQNVSFTLVALFSSVILTIPIATAGILAAMVFIALGLSMVFERRAFCRYVCPVGGFIGLYAQTSPVELRAKDFKVCVTCAGKPCYNGSAAGYGCPWQVFPGGLKRNTYCGLCMECLRTCPHDNIAVNLRPPAADLAIPSRRMDEAFKAFIMVGAALIYAAIFLGPWGALKEAAFRVGSNAWFVYVAAFLAIIFAFLPACHAFAVSLGVRLSRKSKQSKPAFAEFSTALIPLGLIFWVAFSLSFVLTNASYVAATASDPLGWGWDLIGTARVPWQPVLSQLLAPAQTFALVGGMLWSGHTARRIGAKAGITSAPVVVFLLALTLTMMWLLL